LPDPDDFAEQYLFHANEADRSFSAQQLARLFPDLPADAATASLGLQRADLVRLKRLFGMDVLDRLLDHGADPGRVAISNWQFLGDVTNAALPGHERVHGAVAGRAAAEGGRVTLTGIERSTPGLRRLAEHVGRLWRARVVIAATVGTGAFVAQRDLHLTHDHIIIPAMGVRHVTASSPDGSTIHAGPLGPGEALHVPAGSTISMAPVNELFVHLELRLERPLPLSLLPMVDQLPVAQQVAWPEDGGVLRDSLTAQWCAMLPSRPGTRFSSVVGSDVAVRRAVGWVRPTFTGGWCALNAQDLDSESSVLVVAAGICLSVPESLLEVVADMLSGGPTRISEINADSPGAARLVDLLVVAGLAEFLPTEHADDTWDAVDIESEDDVVDL
jgi:hypothetical protein